MAELPLDDDRACGLDVVYGLSRCDVLVLMPPPLANILLRLWVAPESEIATRPDNPIRVLSAGAPRLKIQTAHSIDATARTHSRQAQLRTGTADPTARLPNSDLEISNSVPLHDAAIIRPN